MVSVSQTRCDGIVTITGSDRIVTFTADDGIVARTGIDPVIARSAINSHHLPIRHRSNRCLNRRSECQRLYRHKYGHHQSAIDGVGTSLSVNTVRSLPPYRLSSPDPPYSMIIACLAMQLVISALTTNNIITAAAGMNSVGVINAGVIIRCPPQMVSPPAPAVMVSLPRPPSD